MTEFIQALPAFGICLALWVVGFMILDPKSFTRFFKQEAYIMDKQALLIGGVCYLIMFIICLALYQEI